MKGEKGYYVYTKTDNGVPRIDRVYPGEEGQEEAAQPPAKNIPPIVGPPHPSNRFHPAAPGRSSGLGPPMFTPMPLLGNPLYPPHLPAPPMAAAPPQQQQQQQFPPEPKFVRLPQFYKLVSDLVHNSTFGIISLELLFDAVEEALSEQNMKMNHIQWNDMGGVIERGIGAGEMNLVFRENLLYTQVAYKNFLESQPSQQSPVVSIAEQFQLMQMGTQPLPNDYCRQTPQPSNGSRQMSQVNAVSPTQSGIGRTRGVAQTAVTFVDNDDEATLIQEQNRPRKDLSKKSKHSELPMATTTDSSHAVFSRARSFDGNSNSRFSTVRLKPELDPWRQRLIFEYLNNKTTVFYPKNPDERNVLSMTVANVVKKWGRRVKKLPEIMLLLKSLWLEHPTMDYKCIGDNMFQVLGFGGINWYQLGIVPDDLSTMRMMQAAYRGIVDIDSLEITEKEKAAMRLAVEVDTDIQLLSIYQIPSESLPAQVFKIISQSSTVKPCWISFSDIMNKTNPLVLNSWAEFNNEKERSDYIVTELKQHDEIFKLERGGVQLRLPMAHLVVV